LDTGNFPIHLPATTKLNKTSAKFNTSRHSLGLCRSVVVTCRYAVPNHVTDVDSIRELLERAVAAVIIQQPMLRVGIADEDTEDPKIVQLDAIDLRHVLELNDRVYTDDKDYEIRLLESLSFQHDQSWPDPSTRPVWKIMVHQVATGGDLSKATCLDIAFVFHHAICDGQAALLFHRDLLKVLNSEDDSSTTIEKHVLQVEPQTDCPGPFESLVPFTLSWLFILKKLWTELIWKNFAPSYLKPALDPSTLPWAGKPNTLEPFKTNIRLINIPSSTLDSLLKACRQHKTTLTPLIHAFVLASLSSRLPASEAPTFTTSTPIGLRHMTVPSFDRNQIHCLVTGFNYSFPLATVATLRDTISNAKPTERSPVRSTAEESKCDAVIFGAARELGTVLKAKVASLPADDEIALLKYVGDTRNFWLSRLGKRKERTWEVSNIGSLKQPDAGFESESQANRTTGWKITKSIFTQGALPIGAAFNVNVAGVEGKGNWITITWQEGIVDKSLMENVANDLAYWTHRLEEKTLLD